MVSIVRLSYQLKDYHPAVTVPNGAKLLSAGWWNGREGGEGLYGWFLIPNPDAPAELRQFHIYGDNNDIPPVSRHPGDNKALTFIASIKVAGPFMVHLFEETT